MAIFLSLRNYKHFMATMLLLLFGVLMPLLKTTDGQSISVCYGKDGDNLPKEQEIINLYNSNGIGKLRIYSPDSKILQVLRVTVTNIELILGVPKDGLQTTDGQSIGVCYGKDGDNLPNEQDVINLYNSNGIGKMRIYSPDPKILQALRGTNIELILDVPNDDLQSLASDPAAAAAWVQTNIQAYPDVKFKYISVGNEVDPNTDTSQYTGYILPAMQNIHSAIVSTGLQDQIRVSTATYTGLLVNTFPPSQSAFNENVRSYIVPIIGFLVQHNFPLLVNVYPYFAYAGNTQSIALEYALFNATRPVVTDPDRNLQYQNLFDALLDSHYAALEKAGGPDVGIVVSETGWPSEGGTGASVDNAGTYYKNLIGHVKRVNGTPRKPNKAIEAFLLAMFDENLKIGAETERHFGLFTPTQQPKYGITFN